MLLVYIVGLGFWLFVGLVICCFVVSFTFDRLLLGGICLLADWFVLLPFCCWSDWICLVFGVSFPLAVDILVFVLSCFACRVVAELDLG